MLELLLTLCTVLGGLTALTAILGFIVKQFLLWRWKRKFTWDDVLRTAHALLKRIEDQGWRPEIVIGLGRSGGIWGGWLAGNLGSLPFTVVDDRYSVNADLHVDFPAGADVLAAIRRTYPDKRRILVVEGATSTGKTPAKFLEEFARELNGLDVKFAVLYKNPASTADIAFVGRHGPEPWPDRFPWHSSDLYRPYLRDIFSRTVPR